MKRLIFLFILVILTGTMVFAQADLQVVARVSLIRNQPITVGQLRAEMERRAWPNLRNRLGRNPTAAELRAEVQNSTLPQRRGVLDAMIDELLVLQAAERDRVTVSDAEVNQQINQLRAVLAQDMGRLPTDEEFALALMNETGQSLPAFRESTRRQLIAQQYLLTQQQAIFATIREPTEEEIVNLYNLSRAQFVRPETVRFSMIHVPNGNDTASRVRARELIDRLNREIGNDPVRFDEAVLRGQSPNSGYQAGDGGFMPRNIAAVQMMGEDFVNTAFSLRHGEVSRVIEGPHGFQIIKITSSLPQRNLELDDIIVPGTTETVRQNIAGALFQQRLQETTVRAAQDLMETLRAGNPFQIMENNLNW